MSEKEVASYKELINIKREKLRSRCLSYKEEKEIHFLISVLEDLIKTAEA